MTVTMSSEQKAKMRVLQTKAESLEGKTKIIICIAGAVFVASQIVHLIGLFAGSTAASIVGSIIAMIAALAIVVGISLLVVSDIYNDKAGRIERDFWQSQCKTEGIFDKGEPMLPWIKEQIRMRLRGNSHQHDERE